MKNPKIALIEASSPNTHVYSRVFLPRVGIPTMGGILKGLGYDVDIWFQAMPNMIQDLGKYDIVGIGSLSSTTDEAYRLADSLKNSDTVVVMGGPHITFMPEEALEHCDYVGIGEGDVSFPALVGALENGDSPEHIPGLAFKLPSGEVKYTGPAETVDFANLPSPDFSISPQVAISGQIPQIITTSRGCPHNCSFCSVSVVFGRKYRFKSNEQVISEIRPIQDQSICFGDDNFCANPERAKSLLRDFIAQDAVPLRWAGEMCVNAAADEELLDLMQQTRCRIMYVGVESVVQDTLKKFGKAHQVEAIERCVNNLHQRNIGIHGMFVMSLDDDLETVEATVDYAIKTDFDTIQITCLVPFPGTEAYEEYQDRLLHREWMLFEGMHVVVRPNKVSPYDMQMAIMNGLKRFYSLKRVAGAYRRGRRWRVKYRAGGYYLVRKWLGENEEYIERLRTQYQ